MCCSVGITKRLRSGGKSSFLKVMFALLLQELQQKGSVQFYVRARPGMASTKAVELMDDESIKIDIAALAENGKANAELIRYLAGEFEVDRSQVSIVSGAKARVKLIRISEYYSNFSSIIPRRSS